MKRILAIIIGLSLALPSQAGLYDYYKQLGQNLPSVAERATLAAECGINNYVGSYQQNVELLDCLELGGGQLGSAPFRPSDIDIKIRQQLVAGAARTGTTLNLDPIIDPTSGHRWTMADIGDIAFATLEPGTTNKEIISWTGMTDNTTYYTLTGVQWGYDATGLTTSTANYKRHNSGARFIITDDDHYLRYQYVNQYDGLMHSSYVPSTDQQVATVGFVENRNGYYEAPVANFAALPTGVNQGEMRVTLDDGKVYTWSGSVWILAGAGGGAGTVYRDDITVTSSAQMTYSLSSGSWPDKKYLQVFRNGSLLAEGASADYTAPTTGATITLLSAPVVGEVITLRVESIDFYNANWSNVNTNLTPDLDATHNIGSSTKRFKDAYLSGNATIGGNLTVTGSSTFSSVTTTIPNTITYGSTTASTNLANQKFVSDFNGYNFSSSSQPTRVINTTYHNTSTQTLFVTISYHVKTPSNISYTELMSFFTGAYTLATIGVATSGVTGEQSVHHRGSVSFFVPPNTDYGTTVSHNGDGSSSVDNWTEFSNK